LGKERGRTRGKGGKKAGNGGGRLAGKGRGKGGTKEKKKEPSPPPAAPAGEGSLLPAWFRHSHSLAVGCFCTLPLWAAYEWARSARGLALPPNGAEALLLWAFGSMGGPGLVLLRWMAGLLVIGSGLLLLERRVPLLRIFPFVILEGLVWGSLIGPLGLLFARQLMPGSARGWEAVLFRSVGAGLYEELFFRLFLLSLLYLLFSRAFAFHGLPRAFALGAAVVLSGFLFALAHHLGPGGDPLSGRLLLFRTVMGVLLGLLFVFRGFGVAVYTHAWYDILFFWFSG